MNQCAVNFLFDYNRVCIGSRFTAVERARIRPHGFTDEMITRKAITALFNSEPSTGGYPESCTNSQKDPDFLNAVWRISVGTQRSYLCHPLPRPSGIVPFQFSFDLYPPFLEILLS